MPLFFFLSGVLYKFSENLSYKEKVFKTIKSVMIPYFSVAFISPFLQYAISGIEIPLGDVVLMIIEGRQNQLDFNAPLWFLPTLFCVEILYYFLHKLISKPYIVFCLLTIGIFAHAFLNNPKWLWGCDSALYYILFYALGDLYSKYFNKSIVVHYLQIVSAFVAVLVFSHVSFWTEKYLALCESNINCVYKSAVDVFAAIVGIFGIVGLSKMRLNPVVSRIGQCSLSIMCFHVIILRMIVNVFQAFGVEINQFSFSYSLFATACTIIVIAWVKSYTIKMLG